LLQAADGGGVNDPSAIAFKLTDDVIGIARLDRGTERALKIEFRFKIDPGHDFPPFQPLTRLSDTRLRYKPASQTHYLLSLAMIDYRALFS
jgi:hypothetical protein